MIHTKKEKNSFEEHDCWNKKCKKTFFGPPLEYCCTGRDCTCMGLPIEPPLCDECAVKFLDESKRMEIVF